MISSTIQYILRMHFFMLFEFEFLNQNIFYWAHFYVKIYYQKISISQFIPKEDVGGDLGDLMAELVAY